VIQSLNTLREVERAGHFKSNASLEFHRGDCPSFKDLQDLCVGMVKIAPRARERERGRKGQWCWWKKQRNNGSN
jgi:hypothetical protein